MGGRYRATVAAASSDGCQHPQDHETTVRQPVERRGRLAGGEAIHQRYSSAAAPEWPPRPRRPALGATTALGCLESFLVPRRVPERSGLGHRRPQEEGLDRADVSAEDRRRRALTSSPPYLYPWRLSPPSAEGGSRIASRA